MKLELMMSCCAGVALTVLVLFGCSKKTVFKNGSDSLKQKSPDIQYPKGFQIPQVGDSFTEFWKNIPKPKSYGYQSLGGTGDCHVFIEFENGSKFACGTDFVGQITYVGLKGEKAPVGVYVENELPVFPYENVTRSDANKRD